MSLQKRATEAILLNERWSLIQSGTNQKVIKIKGSRLYINNRLHGQVTSNFIVILLSLMLPLDSQAPI